MPVNFPRQAAPRPWTTGELRRLREVCATGLTIDQIHARGLFPGRTRSALGTAVEKNQCSPRRRPKAAHGYVIVSATMPPTLRAWLASEARRLRSTRAEALRRILSAVRAGAVKVESDPMYKPSRRTGMEPDAGGSAIACVAPRWFPVRRLTCSNCSRYIRVRDPDSATADRDQGLPFQRVSVLADYFVHQHDALLDGQIRKSSYACVVGSSDAHELAEVVVQRDQDSPLRVGPFQQGCVAWIGFEFTGVEDVVAVAPQPLCKPSAGAAVDEEPHGVFTETAASVSPAITACAYAIHARMSSFSSFG